MIDHFVAFTKGGIIKWQHSPSSAANVTHIVNDLISDVFIEESHPVQDSTYSKDIYTARWAVANDQGLVFVCIYKTLLHLPWVGQLVTQARQLYPQLDENEFAAWFHTKLASLEAETVKPEPTKAPAIEKIESVETDSAASGASTPIGGKTRRRGKKGKKDEPVEKKKKGVMRKWGEDGQALDVGSDDDEALDFSSGPSGAQAVVEDVDLASYGGANKQGDFVLKQLGDDEPPIPSKSRFGFLKNIMGGKTITQEDMDKVTAKVEEQLMKKNVAKEVAVHLCDQVSRSLVGCTTNSWTTVEQTVQQAMADALRKILTPSASLDLLHEVQRHKKLGGGRPYVISVVGVNGVGKSTNLSKIGFWLLQNKMRLLVAACDTFRSGAVEQLGVHVNRLSELAGRQGTGEVELFAQGYGKDPAHTAEKAVEYGQKHGFDVVLIDTAGRRHSDKHHHGWRGPGGH
ncbi:Signal recognition particle receptor subunit alpha-like protein [Yarrowia sp. B02]|nr:Signal recognition particle receptor subunit alpha-like protein [Yarrowia sp. B02]